jgi:hypothetical protein
VKLPPITGRPVRLEIRTALKDGRGPVHAGAFLRERRIAFDAALAGKPREFNRVLVHELFHFVWLRLGNARRRAYEDLLRREMLRGARGELGWSAEWRKRELAAADCEARSRRWREYACESFCDTAAWLYSGVRGHAEFTLARRFREDRRRWFALANVDKRISI